MERDTMYALSPLDGRYNQIGEELAPYFSEYALVEKRVKVEVLWLKFLLEKIEGAQVLEDFKHYEAEKKAVLDAIESIYTSFDEDSYVQVKEIEKVTNHDVKAVELFIGEKLADFGKLVSFTHIGCTSEDINNTAYAMMMQEGLKQVWIPAAQELICHIRDMALMYAKTPMLAHTHGQPATPTTVGKEMAVFVYRLQKSLDSIQELESNICAKFNGATGNYAAISAAFPEENWPELAKEFVQDYLKLKFNPVTTQIENHDYMCHIFDGIRHFNNVLLDFDRDMWLYISMEYFKQIAVKTEVGSSTMPHKVNPIRFENSEANIDMSNAICMALSNKLPISRMQRDLSDSSSQRNIGLAFGYSLQAIKQTIGGLKKVAVNEAKLASDLNSKWEVLAEPIQTILRKYGIPDAYDQLKALTRGKGISKEAIQKFIKSLDILSEKDKVRLLKMTPSDYIGLAEQITEEELKNI